LSKTVMGIETKSYELQPVVRLGRIPKAVAFKFVPTRVALKDF